MAHAFDHPNASLSEGEPSPLWSRLCPETLIGSGLARILRILSGKAPCGAGPPRTARRGTAQEGEEVEGATPCFLPLVRHRAGVGGAPQWSHHLPSPVGVAPSTVIPAGRLKYSLSQSRPADRVLRPNRKPHTSRSARGNVQLNGFAFHRGEREPIDS